MSPSDCERFVNEKVLLAHGEIGHVSDFDAHMAACATCSADVEEMREVRRRYRDASSAPMPDALRARLLTLRPQPVRVPAWQRWVTVAAAAVLIGVLIFPLVRPETPRPDDPKKTEAPTAYDQTFRFDSVDAVRASLPPPKPKDPPPTREVNVDRKMRELKKKIERLNDDDW